MLPPVCPLVPNLSNSTALSAQLATTALSTVEHSAGSALQWMYNQLSPWESDAAANRVGAELQVQERFSLGTALAVSFVVAGAWNLGRGWLQDRRMLQARAALAQDLPVPARIQQRRNATAGGAGAQQWLQTRLTPPAAPGEAT